MGIIDLFPNELSDFAERENFSKAYMTSSLNFNLGQLSYLEAYLNDKMLTMRQEPFSKSIGDDIINRFPDDPRGYGFAFDLESYIALTKEAFKRPLGMNTARLGILKQR